MKKIIAVLGAVALLGGLSAAPAGATNGMDMIGYGARAIGMGGADVAVDSDASSVSGNPAVVSQVVPNSANVGLTVLMPELTYKDPYQTVDGENQYFFMPSLGYVHTLAGTPWALGIGVYAQGGMGVDFQDVAPGPGAAPDELTSEVAYLRVNPLAAYKVNENLSLGASVLFGYTMMKFSMFPETAGGAGGVKVEDLASFGYAAKVGAQYAIGPQWRFGATYTTQAKIDMDGGTATLNFGPQGGKVKYDAAMEDFTWPQEVELGVAYLPVKGLTLAADVKWINWSATVDAPKLKVSDPPAGFPPTPFPGANGQQMASDTYVFPMGWKDQWVYSIGAEYALNEKHTVRAGFNYGNNPVPDEKLNALFPAIVTTHLTLGYGYTSGKWSFDAAYEHAFEESQKSTNPAMPIEIAHSQNTVSIGATYRY
jgi:long-chain fatty acid transport protein